MSEQIDVDTGEVAVASGSGSLRVLALGSCVAVIAYDRAGKRGGLAHVMLPGRSPKRKDENRTRYAEDAIDVLFEKMKGLGVRIEDLEIILIGGANVLGEGDIPVLVVNSVFGYFKELGIEPVKVELGGTQRRSVLIDTGSGRIIYTKGDGPAEELETGR